MSRNTGHTFAQVPTADIPRSQFNRSHGYKTTFDAGRLIPIFVDEVIPGDTFALRLHGFGRMATPIRPIMDNLYLDTFFFFVPTRLIWSNFEKFMGAQDNPGDSTDYIVPRLAAPENAFVREGRLADYFGLPIGMKLGTTARRVNALPFRAYRLIFNEWFRDQNVRDSLEINLGDGPDSNDVTGWDDRPHLRYKRHDYFTSALPWPQKGDSVSIPLGDVAPIGYDNESPTLPAGNVGVKLRKNGPEWTALDSSGSLVEPSTSPSNPSTRLYAHLQDASSTSINALRQAFQVQRMLERDARGGTRYVELLRSHFRVTSPDARLQRPEYLGGGSSRINISPVANTTGTSEANQGDLAALGTINFSGHGFRKSFVEHGYIIGIASVRADMTYQQGIDRFWSRETRYDFYWPSLAHIGEQAILSQEIYAGTFDQADLAVFGYQERYAEYRFKQSRVTGQFSSLAETPLDMWHLAQEFAERPELNEFFLHENPPVNRVIATPSEPHFLLDAWFDLKCARPMPVFGVPGLIDHF